MIERKRFSSIATLVLIFFIFAAGHASAQEGTPPATPSAVAAIPSGCDSRRDLVGWTGSDCGNLRGTGWGAVLLEAAQRFWRGRPMKSLPAPSGQCGRLLKSLQPTGGFRQATVASGLPFQCRPLRRRRLLPRQCRRPRQRPRWRRPCCRRLPLYPFPCQRWRFQGAGSGLRMTGWATRWPCLSPGLPST